MIDPSLSLKILSSSGSKVLKSPKGLYCSHGHPLIVKICQVHSIALQSCYRITKAMSATKVTTCITAEGNPLIWGKRLTST